MVFVKVRETYDLHTLPNKMTVIGIHTPSASIIQKNYPGLLMQCKAYRPVKCDVRLACASVLPVDPQGVGTTEGDVAPEDIFNPLLYKPMSNFGMSQLDGYIAAGGAVSISGATLDANNHGINQVEGGDDFDIYYGLLSQTHEWKHANPQAGLSMIGLVPLVYETYQTIGDNNYNGADNPHVAIQPDDTISTGQIGNIAVQTYRGRSHPLPMLNCTVPIPENGVPASAQPGFRTNLNAQLGVPAPKIYCGCIITPPSRLHQLFFRMVCEWILEFTSIRPLAEITTWAGLKSLGQTTHFMSYDYSASANSKETVLSDSTELVDTTADSGIKKVM